MKVMKLSGLYHEMFSEDKSDWFYSSMRDFTVEKLDRQDICFSELKKLLQNRNKEEFQLVKHFFEPADHYAIKSRAQHILSCYCLGKIFYDKSSRIKESIDDFVNINGLNPKLDLQPFRYLWMLICLFHDLGYVYESKIVEAQDDFIEKQLQGMPESTLGIPYIYTKKLLSSYHEYRKCRFSVKDHGLAGGAILFKDLCKHFKDRTDGWREKLHSCVSWVIACHNIYYSSNKDEKCYKCKSLDNLCKETNPRNITLAYHPLLFLFCLIDTLEPLKVFCTTEALESIDLDFSEDITVKINLPCGGQKIDFCNRIRSLNSWLTDVTCIESTECICMSIKL